MYFVLAIEFCRRVKELEIQVQALTNNLRSLERCEEKVRVDYESNYGHHLVHFPVILKPYLCCQLTLYSAVETKVCHFGLLKLISQDHLPGIEYGCEGSRELFKLMTHKKLARWG